MKPYKFIATIFILALLVGACNLPDGTSVSEEDIIRFAQETLQAQIDAGEVLPQGQAPPPAEQPPADQASSDSGNGTVTEASSSAGTPTITLTPASGAATVSVTTATNCRAGPGVPHTINGALSPGQTGNITAQASVSNYVIIQNPGGGPDCWLWLQHATISGDISGLPVVTPPPTPTPTFTPTFTATTTATPVATMNWTGAWTTQFVQGGSIIINTTQSGNTILGSGLSKASNGNTFTFNINGTVSADGKTVTGSWSTTASALSGSFTWQLVGGSMDQFNGNALVLAPTAEAGTTFGWCGGRNGAGLPVTCLGP